jgi:Zn-finger domain-containing protein
LWDFRFDLQIWHTPGNKRKFVAVMGEVTLFSIGGKLDRRNDFLSVFPFFENFPRMTVNLKKTGRTGQCH